MASERDDWSNLYEALTRACSDFYRSFTKAAPKN